MNILFFLRNKCQRINRVILCIFSRLCPGWLGWEGEGIEQGAYHRKHMLSLTFIASLGRVESNRIFGKKP